MTAVPETRSSLHFMRANANEWSGRQRLTPVPPQDGSRPRVQIEQNHVRVDLRRRCDPGIKPQHAHALDPRTPFGQGHEEYVIDPVEVGHLVNLRTVFQSTLPMTWPTKMGPRTGAKCWAAVVGISAHGNKIRQHEDRQARILLVTT
eukprot:1112172-Rhodomonas_salina.2